MSEDCRHDISVSKTTSLYKTGKLAQMVVETPKKSAVKYTFDPDTGLFVLKRALPSGMTFPFNFGFVLSTLAEDGDPLDMMLLNDEPLQTGTLIKVRPLAILRARQSDGKKKVRNDRIIGVAKPEEDIVGMAARTLTKEILDEIEFFFVAYHKGFGNTFEVLGHGGWGEAIKAIKRARDQFFKGNSGQNSQ
jgi:inorganic pyrophosphatase